MATIRTRKTKDKIDEETGKVIEKGKNRYQAIIRIPEGRDSKAFSTNKAAKDWANRVENEMRQGIYSKQQESSKHTVSELIERYMADHKFIEKKDVSNQERHLAFWKGRIGDKKLIDVSRALIIEVRDEVAAVKTNRGGLRSAATVNRFVAVIRQAFSMAIEWEWVDSNPCKGISSMTEPPGVVRFLSDSERKALLDATQETDPTLHLIVVLALSTGARRGEIVGARNKDPTKDKLGLLWKDIHWNEGFAVLRDTKNSESRGMPLVGMAMELLKAHRDENRQLTDKLVFPDPVNRSRPWNFESLWGKAKKKAEIENFRFHDLRHSAASYLAMGGATPGDIAEVLGHKTLAMVKRYSHLSNDHVSSVVEKMNAKIFGG